MPKLKTLQIVWHGKEPVYSLDFHPNGLLVTSGADKEIKIWKVLKDTEGYPTVEHTGSLTGHSKTVNCVRVSPNGKKIVSAGDGGELLLWTPQEQVLAGNLVSEEEAQAGWRRAAVLRGHTDDVMDLAWSVDGTAMLSGSIDNKSMIWEISEKKMGSMVAHFANHKHFVQGVAWDPLQQFVVTQSADRTCKVYALRPPPASKKNKNKSKKSDMPASASSKEFYCSHTMSKRIVGSSSGEGQPQRQALFHDESLPSFFRRPSWSPDGSFLIVPAGVYRADVGSAEQNTAYLYARGKWASPVAHVPGQPKPVVSVKFCPILFERDQDVDPPKPFELLPYKIVYAVATLDSIILYDTSSSLPIAAFSQIHFDSITDIAWSRNGDYLAISSRDCFCSIIAFEKDELGQRMDPAKIPQHINAVMQPLRYSDKETNEKPSIEPGCSGKENNTAQKTETAVMSTEKAKGKRKRITATPVDMPENTPIDLTAAAAAAATPTTRAPTPPVSGQKEKRRITPVPIEKPSTSESAQKQTFGMNIAALAAAAGQNEAGKNPCE